MHSSSCSSVITNGGANRIISSWVGFAKRPFSFNFKHISQALKPNPNNLKNILFEYICYKLENE